MALEFILRFSYDSQYANGLWGGVWGCGIKSRWVIELITKQKEKSCDS